MKTPQDLMREQYPEFLKTINEFNKIFGQIKREYIKCSIGEWGSKFEGVEINPVLSKKILTRKELKNGQ